MMSHKIYSLYTPIEFYVSDFPNKLKMHFIKTFTLTYRYRKYVFLTGIQNIEIFNLRKP